MVSYANILEEYLSNTYKQASSKDEVQRLWILSKIQKLEKEKDMNSDNALLHKIANECEETNSLLKNMIKILSKT